MLGNKGCKMMQPLLNSQLIQFLLALSVHQYNEAAVSYSWFGSITGIGVLYIQT